MEKEKLVSVINNTAWDYYMELSYTTEFVIADCRITMEQYFNVLCQYKSTMLWIAVPISDTKSIYTIHVLIRVEKQFMALMVKGSLYFKDIWVNLNNSSRDMIKVERFDRTKITIDYITKDINLKDAIYNFLTS